MKLWTSSKAWREASEECSLLMRLIEKEINEELVSANFQMDGVDQWSVITIILPDDILGTFGCDEVQRFHRKRKDFEFGLRIDYQAFMKSDYPGKAQLIFDMLFRSIDIMATKKIPQPQIDALKRACIKVLEKVKQIGDLKKVCLDMFEKIKAEGLEKNKAKALEKAKAETPEKLKANELHTSFLESKTVMKTIMISSFEDLCKIGKEAAYPLDGNYELTSNIDASGSKQMNSGQGFEPIGSCILGEWGNIVLETPFAGIFNGKGFFINELYIARPKSDCVGLFGYTGMGAQIVHTHLVANVSGRDRVGALVGSNNMCLITECSAVVEVNGAANVGGLVGSNAMGIITKCRSEGHINGKDGAGGLVAFNKGIVDACYAIGKVNGITDTGGLVGFNAGIITKCYATAEVIGRDADIGGLAGVNINSTISNCYATGDVEGKEFVGGLVGGNSSGTITECYSIGKVKGKDNTGGLVGDNKSWRKHTDGTVSDCYWDIATSGLTTSDGGIGKKTVQMKEKDTYKDWNFRDTWQMEEHDAYPSLRILPRPLSAAGKISLKPSVHDNEISPICFLKKLFSRLNQ
jgi:hypothetical protein